VTASQGAGSRGGASDSVGPTGASDSVGPTGASDSVGPTGAPQDATEIVRLDGHVVDSLLLAKVLDAILDAGATYRIIELDVGTTSVDPSHVRLEVTAADEESLDALLSDLQVHGVNRVDADDAELVAADRDGVLPEGFYSTTNLPTSVRVGGHWVSSGRPEMDCAIVVEADNKRSARVVPMHRVMRGDKVVVGWKGVRVENPTRQSDAQGFGFMTSEVSSEKPKALSVARVADALRRARSERDSGSLSRRGRILAVCGPAVVHTGAAPHLARLVHDGWVDVLFAGNGFATHDIESSVLGTSLGISLGEGVPAEHGHANHLRVINEVRRAGSIAAAVEAGWLRSGVLYECVRAGIPFVLGGSVRDDGPLPDVYSDTLQAADAMREHIDGVDVALMLASTLHAIATGNLLPAGVETFCIDINQAVVTKLTDRGSHQALGIVTDVGLFVMELADRLCGPADPGRADPGRADAGGADAGPADAGDADRGSVTGLESPRPQRRAPLGAG
jgi:lysine-ketoglutarate reductase/saccharopine dehydrogenase-like protein (TIGR00300 family)